ncbi:MAG TPA: hypothetical protein VKA60_09275 [Blastocatellia bacterium]|nr:hypothetical protein [Blastocatellia bacterium]
MQRVVMASALLTMFVMPLPSVAGAAAIKAVAENWSAATTCAEDDNVNVALRSKLVQSFQVTALHPAYEIGNDNCAADFSGCAAARAKVDAGASSCQTLWDDGTNIIQACTEDGWWRPYAMTMHVVNGMVASGHRLVLSRKIDDEFSWPQFMVLYEDGNLRLKPHPPKGFADVCFGSSVIIGPAAPSTRPYVDIQRVDINPATLCADIYYSVGVAHVCFSVNRSQAVAAVRVGYRSANPFATFRSMWVADGNSDVDHLQTGAGDFPILSPWNHLSGPSWLFHRNLRSSHNTSAPDIKIDILQ